MTAPYARFSTSVTPNCSVKPIAEIASTEAVTSPKPSEARKMVTTAPPGCRLVCASRQMERGRRSGLSSGQRPQLPSRYVPDDVHRAVGAVGVNLEDAGRVVEA